MQALLSIIGLGLLGLDPLAAMLVTSAIAVHSKRYKILLFTLSFLFGTVALGVAISMLGQNTIDYIQSITPSNISPVWWILNIIIILVIIIWLVMRLLKRNTPNKKERKSRQLLGSTWQFITAGLLFALSALADPTFYAVIVIAAETHNIFAMAGIHLLWISITQIPLFVIVIAYYLNAHTKLLAYTDKTWEANKQKAMTLLYFAAIILALILLVDTIVYMALGTYWF